MTNLREAAIAATAYTPCIWQEILILAYLIFFKIKTVARAHPACINTVRKWLGWNFQQN